MEGPASLIPQGVRPAALAERAVPLEGMQRRADCQQRYGRRESVGEVPGDVTKNATRKRGSTYPVVCGECCELADQAAIHEALRRGTAYVHGCGRVLVRA